MRFDGHGSTREVLEQLIKYARPGGQAHRRLTRYIEMTDRNVFLGPAAYRYIEKLIAIHDNIECRYLSKTEEMCLRIGKGCPFVGRFEECSGYSKNTMERGDPISVEGE